MTLRSILSAAAIGLAAVAAPAAAGPASAPHAAACVAALKAQEASLAEIVKAGEPLETVQAVLLNVVRSGITIIGTQYLAGLREGEARELLKAAEREFQALPPAAAEERQAACLKEGETLYSNASPLERSLITTAAQRRIKRLTAST